jgi:3-deoxy-D-manno-octulosonic-acid transferase
MWSQVYSVLTATTAPFAAMMGLLTERGRVRCGERFGIWGDECVSEVATMWFHGASMGEVRGLLPLIKLFKERHPGLRILLTSISPTGIDVGKNDVDEVHILPFDAVSFHRRALAGRNIVGLVINETELWPSLLLVAREKNIPTFLVNGRISDMTIKRYQNLKFILKEALPQFTRVLVSTRESYDRFLELGCIESQLAVMGNSKYDGIRVVSEGEREEFRNRFGFGSLPIICLGSIRDGEDDLWLGAVKALRDRGLKFNTIVAPRHREKVEYFAKALRKYDLPFARYTAWEERNYVDYGECNNKVLLIDTYGKLLEAYAVSVMAFIGATLVDIGGHNPLEAAAQSVPVVVGPYIQNVKVEVADLAKVDGLMRVENQPDIINVVSDCLQNLKEYQKKGKRAYEQWQQHQGSAVRIINDIEKNMEMPHATAV